MINYENMRAVIVKGLKKYLNCPVIRSNQNEEPPSYPFISYTVTQLMSENKGTYGAYEDGKDRKAFTQTWSISALSADNTESVSLAVKAREWLDHVGTVYLSDNGVDVQSVGVVTNRDNVLTVEYEYKNGFDVVFSLFDEVDNGMEEAGYIETVEFNGEKVEPRPSEEELVEKLKNRLSGR
jgi:hypothetical protein